MIFLLTQSGETFDILECARRIHPRDGLTILGVTNAPTSSITRLIPESIFIGAGPERGVAATKSFTMQALHLLHLLASFRPFQETPPGTIADVLDDIHTVWMNEDHSWIRRLSMFQSIFILSRETAIAREGALKMKELAYIHAEGYHMGSLKHGPFAMLDGVTAAVIMVCTDTTRQDEDWSVYQD